MRLLLPGFAFCLFLGAFGCGQEPDCAAICETAIACDITFAPQDDSSLERVKDGSRTPQDSCVLGCQDNSAVDAEADACIAGIDVKDAGCQEQFLACFDAASATK